VSLVKYQPILVRYFTCGVEQGRVHYYADCYDLDKPLIQAIYGQ
jgi:murein L,D-transpeptidase YcbB/YkuD